MLAARKDVRMQVSLAQAVLGLVFISGGIGLTMCGDAWQLEKNLEGHKALVNQVLWVPNKGVMFSSGRDGKVFLWDANRNWSSNQILTAIRTFSTPTGPLTDVAEFNSLRNTPDGKIVLGACSNGKVFKWYGESFLESDSVDIGSENVWNCEISPDGKAFLAMQTHCVSIWNCADLSRVAICEIDSGIQLACFAGGGKVVLLDKDLKIWIPNRRETVVVREVDVDFKLAHQMLIASSDGRYVYIGGRYGSLIAIDLDRKCKQWRVDSLGNVKGGFLIHDGSELVVFGSRGTMIYDAKTGNLIKNYPEKDVIHSSISGDESRLISSSPNNVYVWSVESGQMLAELSPHAGMPCIVGFSADGNHAYSTSFEGELKIWRRTRTEGLKGILELPLFWITAISAASLGFSIVKGLVEKYGVRMQGYGTVH